MALSLALQRRGVIRRKLLRLERLDVLEAIGDASASFMKRGP
jgi:hypothetical protein